MVRGRKDALLFVQSQGRDPHAVPGSGLRDPLSLIPSALRIRYARLHTPTSKPNLRFSIHGCKRCGRPGSALPAVEAELW